MNVQFLRKEIKIGNWACKKAFNFIHVNNRHGNKTRKRYHFSLIILSKIQNFMTSYPDGECGETDSHALRESINWSHIYEGHFGSIEHIFILSNFTAGNLI